MVEETLFDNEREEVDIVPFILVVVIEVVVVGGDLVRMVVNFS